MRGTNADDSVISSVASAWDTDRWKLLEKLKTGTERSGEAGDNARSVWTSLQDAVAIPGRSLSDEMSTAGNKVVTWVVDDEPPTPPEPPEPPQPQTPKRETVLRGPADLSKLDAELTKALKDPSKTVHVHWWVE